MAYFCVSCPRRSGPSPRRVSLRSERLEHLCIPNNNSDSESVKKVRSTKYSGHGDSSQMPVITKLLKRPGSSQYHQNPGLFRLHACSLSGDLSRRKDFHMGLEKWSPNLSENLPLRSTTLVGRSSVFGVLRGNVILARPPEVELADFILHLVEEKNCQIRLSRVICLQSLRYDD